MAVRLVRLLRLALHVVRGVALTRLRFPRMSDSERHAVKRRWSRKLLSILSVSAARTDTDRIESNFLDQRRFTACW